MKTLEQRRRDIAALQVEFRRLASLNQGVIRGAIDTQDLQAEIIRLMDVYNQRAKRTCYVRGIIEPRR